MLFYIYSTLSVKSSSVQQNAFWASVTRICQMLEAIERHSSHIAYIDQGYMSHYSEWKNVIQCCKLWNAKEAEMEVTAILVETVE